MKESIVLYPAPAFHHMLSMINLAKLILQHHPNFFITILVPALPVDTPSYNNLIISQTNLPISFLSLPSFHFPQPSPSPKPGSRVNTVFDIIRLNVPHVLDALENLSLTSKVLALITSSVHSFYHPLIPTYYYFTSCASTLAAFLYLPTIHNQTTKSFKEIPNTLFHFPGLPPLKSSHLPEPIQDRGDPAYDHFLNVATCLPKSKGIIVNSFDLLEGQAIKAIANGACVPDGETPPVYCIGPLIVDAKDRAGGALNDESYGCLKWLDKQPRHSVVFLCFGSRGAFSDAQVKEIATGLERSKQRFLWVVKNPPNSQEEAKPESVLPEGFLDRTKERGMVIKSWAPQADILSHISVGGFVSHCGWNSVVEAVSYGVPMVAWPLYAEQKLNSVVMVEEMKIAIPISDTSSSSSSSSKELDLDGNQERIVSAEEVEKKVRELMGLEGKAALRERSSEVKEMGMAAWKGNGSSFNAFSNMVASWK